MKQAQTDGQQQAPASPSDRLSSRSDGASNDQAAVPSGTALELNERDPLAPAIRAAIARVLVTAHVRWEAERRDPDSAEARIAAGRQAQAEEQLAATLLPGTGLQAPRRSQASAGMRSEPRSVTHDEADHHAARRRRSASLAAADLVEAVYRGADAGLAGFVGRAALWVVVGERDAMTQLSPHPLPLDVLDGIRPGVAPLIDFDDVKRVGSILDDE